MIILTFWADDTCREYEKVGDAAAFAAGDVR
jgi:hypothetical protein